MKSHKLLTTKSYTTFTPKKGVSEDVVEAVIEENCLIELEDIIDLLDISKVQEGVRNELCIGELVDYYY